MTAAVRHSGRREGQDFIFTKDTVTVRPASPLRSSGVDFQYPILDFPSVLKRDPATVRRAHDGPSWDPSIQTVITRNYSAAQND